MWLSYARESRSRTRLRAAGADPLVTGAFVCHL